MASEETKNLKRMEPYFTEVKKGKFSRGKMYEYETAIPYVGLVVTVACNGYGFGGSKSYVVTEIKTDRKTGRVIGAFVNKVVNYDEKGLDYEEVTSRYERRYLVPVGDKEGSWRWKGDGKVILYFVTWGRIVPPEPHDMFR